MSVLLHISDTHFGTEDPVVTEALLQFAMAQKPHLVIVSGDITQRARRAEFTAARSFLDWLGTPALVLPGNHDIPLFNLPARLFWPYDGYRLAFGNRLDPEFANADTLVIGVNTTRWWRHSDGEVSPLQVEVVAARLRQALPEQLRIVVTHQPVHVTKQRDQTNRLHNHESAIRAWSDAGADLILGGHIHLPYFRSLRAQYIDLPREVWAIQAGTAISRRVRFEAPNSVNLLRYLPTQRDRCIVERWDFSAEERAFKLNESLEALLDRHPLPVPD